VTIDGALLDEVEPSDEPSIVAPTEEPVAAPPVESSTSKTHTEDGTCNTPSGDALFLLAGLTCYALLTTLVLAWIFIL